MPRVPRTHYVVLQPVTIDKLVLWLRVGTAHMNADGTLDVRLDVIAVGQLWLRALTPEERTAPETDELAS